VLAGHVIVEFGKRVGVRLEGTGGGFLYRVQVGLEVQSQIPGMLRQETFRRGSPLLSKGAQETQVLIG
jgi:hypothetical protein